MTPQDSARRIVERLREAGYEAYWAGGCVRDMLLGGTPQDYDIATSARPEEVTALFDRTISVGAQFGVIIVREDDHSIEVATFRADGPPADGRRPLTVHFCGAREDVERRDFTINGMLYDPIREQVLDWVGGRLDLERGVIRTIGDPRQRFEEDRLRMMRAIRFAARFAFEIEDATRQAIVAMTPLLGTVSAERIRDEFLKIITQPHPRQGLRLLHETGLLRVFLPEVARMAGIEQPPKFHPEGDVFEHTCLMLELASEPSAELALGIVLHDVGKPLTQTFDDRIRFNEHDAVGARVSRQVCSRLRLSRAQTDHVVALVATHMRLLEARNMKQSTLRRLLALPRFDEHLELHRLDCKGSHGELDNYEFLVGKVDEFAREKPVPPPLLTGKDLIAMGLEPGPEFGAILDEIEERQLNGELSTREEAIDFVRREYVESG